MRSASWMASARPLAVWEGAAEALRHCGDANSQRHHPDCRVRYSSSDSASPVISGCTRPNARGGDEADADFGYRIC
jgi:hypothetical protein